MTLKCKICNQNTKENEFLPHKQCKLSIFDVFKTKMSAEIEEYEQIILKLKEEIRVVKKIYDSKINDLYEQIRTLKDESNPPRRTTNSLDLFSDLDNDNSRQEFLNDAIYMNKSNAKDDSQNECEISIEKNVSPLKIKPETESSPKIKKAKMQKNILRSPLLNTVVQSEKYQPSEWNSKANIQKKKEKENNNLDGKSKQSSFHKKISLDKSKLQINNIKENENNIKRPSSILSLNKSKNLKQSVIKFPKNNTETLEKDIIKFFDDESNNETFCDEFIMPSPASSSSRLLKSRMQKNLSLNVKSFNNKNLNDHKTNSELDSVEILPTLQTEIIEIQDSMMAFDPNEYNYNSADESCDLLREILREKKPCKEVEKSTKEFQFQRSPIRNKIEKAKQPGFDCQDCENYYKTIGYKMTDAQMEQRKKNCSKHRQNTRLHCTPDGFWKPFFTPTQADTRNNDTIDECDL